METVPSRSASRRRNTSFVVSLIAFSGVMPISCAGKPLYRPSAPSSATIVRNAWPTPRYLSEPSAARVCVCSRVFTMSIG